MTEPTDQHELDSRGEWCKVCDDILVDGFDYGFWICLTCRRFLSLCFNSKKRHMPCNRFHQCDIIKGRYQCPCCRLTKGVNLGMDPYFLIRKRITSYTIVKTSSIEFPFPPCTGNRTECPCCYLKKSLALKPTGGINRDSIFKFVPVNWIFLLSCKTCNSTKIQAINKSIEDLKSFYVLLKEQHFPEEVGEESVERKFENCDRNSLNTPDFVTKHSSLFPPNPDDTLKENNSINGDPRSLFNECISNYNPNSVTSESFAICSSDQITATDEDDEQISFEDGLIKLFKENDADPSSEPLSHIAVLALAENNLQHIEPRPMFIKALQCNFNYPNSVWSQYYPTCSLSESSGTVENYEQISFEDGLKMLFKEKDADPSCGSRSQITVYPLKENNLQPIEPMPMSKETLQRISNNYPNSVWSQYYPTCSSSQSTATVENYENISLDEGLEMISGKRSADYSSGSHIYVRTDISSTVSLSSCPPPYMDLINIAWEQAMEDTDESDSDD